MNDLFGQEIKSEEKKKGQPKGYAYPPGTGPTGETCKTCEHSYRRQGGSNAYFKCDLVPPTNGPGTDIRLKSPACFKWTPKQTEA
jgi:hypothetical protein